MQVSSTKDSSSVSSTVKKTGAIICLIIGATALQFMANYQVKLETAEPVSSPVLQASHPTLKAASPIVEDYPESYYDKTSSHYMGGAHNAALKAMASGQTKKTKTAAVQVPTQTSMGGAHNSALNALAIQANRKAKSTKSKSSMAFFPTLGSSGSSYVQRPLTKAEFNKNVKATGAFLGLIGTVGLCIYFFVNLKTYHASLEKLEALTAIINNPNARVATKEQGKEVMKKLQASKAPETSSANVDLEKADQI